MAVVAAVALTLVSASSASAAGSPFKPKAWTEVATLLDSHHIFASQHGGRLGFQPDHRPITGERTSLPVLATAIRGGTKWLLVRLTAGGTGWISARHTRLWEDPWHVVVSIRQRRAYIYKAGRLIRDWLVVVGTPAYPTAAGQFFVVENIKERPTFPGAPYVLALDVFSHTFIENGHFAQLALHGEGGGLYARPGTAASHGCVRFLNWQITWLAHRLGVGTPVTIVR